MQIKELWEYVCFFLPLPSIYSLACVSKLHGELCSTNSLLWIKLLDRIHMLVPLYYTPHTNWKLIFKLSLRMLNWDPMCLAHKATLCVIQYYLIPVTYNARTPDASHHLPTISNICLLGLAGAGRSFFLRKILPLHFRERINVLTLNDTPFPTIEKLEEDVNAAISSQEPVVIIVDDLTAMNGVYAHPFVCNADYQGRFVKILQKAKNTENKILFLVSINLDPTALQLFAGAVKWDWLLYFGVPSIKVCNFLIQKQFGNKEFPPQKDFPELLTRIKQNTLSEITYLFSRILQEEMKARLENRSPTLSEIFKTTNYMKSPQSCEPFSSLLQSLNIETTYGTIPVNSSELDAGVVKTLVSKRKRDEDRSLSPAAREAWKRYREGVDYCPEEGYNK